MPLYQDKWHFQWSFGAATCSSEVATNTNLVPVMWWQRRVASDYYNAEKCSKPGMSSRQPTDYSKRDPGGFNRLSMVLKSPWSIINLKRFNLYLSDNDFIIWVTSKYFCTMCVTVTVPTTSRDFWLTFPIHLCQALYFIHPHLNNWLVQQLSVNKVAATKAVCFWSADLSISGFKPVRSWLSHLPTIPSISQYCQRGPTLHFLKKLAS